MDDLPADDTVERAKSVPTSPWHRESGRPVTQYPNYPPRVSADPNPPRFDRPHPMKVLLLGLVVVVVVALVTVVAYLVLLGWHRPDRSYETWRILALGGVLAALAVGYGWRGYFLAGSAMQALALTVLWTVDVLSDPHTDDDGFLLVGMLSMLIGAAAGALCFSRPAQALRDALKRRSELHKAVNDFNNEPPRTSH